MVRPERRRALNEALEDLRKYRARYDEQTFLTDRDAQRLVLHGLYIAVQACLDEAFEICREQNIESSGRYRDALLALGQAGILDAQLAARLADWASFRNVLAHFYPVIDLRRVYGALDDLGDLEAFARLTERRA